MFEKILLPAVLPVLLLLVSPGLVLGQTAKPEARQMKQMPTKAKANAAGEDMRMAQAREWLKSVGYDLAYDQMKTLKRLNLQKYSIAIQSQITDDNLRHIEVLTGLEILQLPNKVGDEGLKHAAGLTNLTSLNMPGCRVTDNGMQYLKNLTKLDSLVMSGLDVTDAGVAQIKHLRPSILNLTRTRITDAGITMLHDMSLRLLFVSFTDITDASVPELAGHTGLERLDIQGKGISPEGAAELRQRLPRTRVVYP